MRINNNITALNAHRQYGINNASIAKSVEKLSSGYRINRAGDDAAGLAISEKMRAQIRGLNMASKNSQDAVSLVQTAEGALQSTHNILQRMRELAVQSASDTNETGIDRAALQQEFEQLQNEINDISTTTRFNDQNLLDGTFQSKLSSLNTSTTSLANVKTISVARAGAGEYEMTVKANAAVDSRVIPGEACVIKASDLTAAASKSDIVSSISFAGLETSAHNGNTYTLKVTGSDVSNMTFQLLDSNNKVVSTAQNVDTAGWAGQTSGATGATGVANPGVVNFQGVGTMTFNIENDKNVTNVAELEALSGAKLNFTSPSGVVVTPTTLSATVYTNGMTQSAVSGSDVGTATSAQWVFTAASNALSDITDEEVTSLSFKVISATNKLTVQVFVNGASTNTYSGSASATTNTITTAGTYKSGGNVSVVVNGFGTFTFTASADVTAFKTTGVTQAFGAGAIKTATASTVSTLATHVNALSAVSKTAAATTGGTPITGLHVELTAGTGYFQSVGAMSNVTVEIAKGTGGASADLVATVKAGSRVIGTYSATDAFAAQLGSGSSISLSLGDLGTLILSATANVTSTDLKTLSQTLTVGVTSAEISSGAGVDPITTNAVQASLDVTINGETVKLKKGDTYANFSQQGIAFEFDALSDVDVANDEFFGKDTTISTSTQVAVKIGVNNTKGSELIIQTGANQGDRLGINIDRISTETLGLDFSNISNQDAAEKAITEVNNAINQVSTQRAALGALQNRLEYKIANLDTSSENLQAAESRIRDVDMAKEMTQFTKNNILAQASTAMLAQANSLPQGVLQLLG